MPLSVAADISTGRWIEGVEPLCAAAARFVAGSDDLAGAVILRDAGLRRSSARLRGTETAVIHGAPALLRGRRSRDNSTAQSGKITGTIIRNRMMFTPRLFDYSRRARALPLVGKRNRSWSFLRAMQS